MIKCVIFDLDGVLIDSKQSHFNALNDALRQFDEKFVISKDEHLHFYDGLPTKQKLNTLTERKGLPALCHGRIWEKKQELTAKYIEDSVRGDSGLIDIFREMRKNGMIVCVATNSIRSTTNHIIYKLGVVDLIDITYTNEDVANPKPHPEIYWKTMIRYGFDPKECLIIEDSPQGLMGASKSGANVLRVKDRKDLTLDKIMNEISNLGNQTAVPRWKDRNLNIVIPMAGLGSRFAEAGHIFPKPLIPLPNMGGKPMIQVVVENLNMDGNYIFIIRKEHVEKYNLAMFLKAIVPNCTVIEIDHNTEGAACTILLAKKYIDNDNMLFMANCDQFIEWNSTDFMYSMTPEYVDGSILTFYNQHPMWSYVKCGEDGFVTDVKEKVVVSTQASTGHYAWRRGRDFVKYAEQMIAKNLRVKGEFYSAPSFVEAIEDGKKIKTYHINKMWSLGIPSDVEYFINNYRNS